MLEENPLPRLLSKEVYRPMEPEIKSLGEGTITTSGPPTGKAFI
jgi:hypothetical protein